MQMQTTAGAPRSAPARLAALGASALVALGLALSTASPALAHDELVGYVVDAETDTGAAEGVTLSFSNQIMAVGTEFIVTGPAGDDASGGDPRVSGRDVTQPLAAPLAAGDYSVAWRVVSSDGHPIQGALTLSVAADGSGALATAEIPASDTDEAAAAETEETTEHEHADEATDQGGTDLSPAVIITIAVVAALVIAGGIVAVTVGGRRRRQAIEQHAAPQHTTDRSSAGNDPGENEETK